MTEFNNVDPADIARFTAMASRWWDPAGEMAPLHHINPARTQYIDKVCGGLAGQKVIDVGCGGGLLSEALARRGAEVTGIDLAEASIAVAREHAGASGLAIDYQCVATEAMAQRAPKSFDVVCCLEMLEHVPDPEAIINACADLLRPGGLAVFSTLNRSPRAFALAIVAAEHVLGLIPKGTHQFAQFIRPSELSRAVMASGLQLVEMKGLHYNPILKNARLNNDLAVNYFLVARKP
ncbi:MAG: bifunctional 2-polyprenyl-6-hydroxyphenol methylase/3-demethylubiquinol 3-O-methyltransferase UbiG [Polycyclovorans sp.]|jgi:2-polyprenyl-6-hydroxyphenyl methylase/3-demethylubiquinone-9 3-methyltransferase|nr:bifunctional 2-polyprenyl-6-hydroxyphenol methylase/3-demethylubiquinol 3-O-methyltransferase UbiG [Gammaproteobacteria bacterium]MEC8848925.1 bifunctional 2-polyprenyl-6-hydroxyphenol methylase/3-demethylubiquinol 3-O-methyltransferase UbiG [Pseudomonadota bacterium]|tara:strand:- start:15461 stop:16168 length:708 start_codon:yes stop_codon:yes gene_type:complete